MPHPTQMEEKIYKIDICPKCKGNNIFHSCREEFTLEGDKTDYGCWDCSGEEGTNNTQHHFDSPLTIEVIKKESLTKARECIRKGCKEHSFICQTHHEEGLRQAHEGGQSKIISELKQASRDALKAVIDEEVKKAREDVIKELTTIAENCEKDGIKDTSWKYQQGWVISKFLRRRIKELSSPSHAPAKRQDTDSGKPSPVCNLPSQEGFISYPDCGYCNGSGQWVCDEEGNEYASPRQCDDCEYRKKKEGQPKEEN